jgi:hypothetical protein
MNRIRRAADEGALWGVRLAAALLIVSLVLFGIGDYLRVRAQAAAGQAALDALVRASQQEQRK